MSPMVWLSAICIALLRQRFIAALILLPLQIMIFILALLKLFTCCEGRVPQEQYLRAARPSCASNSFL